MLLGVLSVWIRGLRLEAANRNLFFCISSNGCLFCVNYVKLRYNPRKINGWNPKKNKMKRKIIFQTFNFVGFKVLNFRGFSHVQPRKVWTMFSHIYPKFPESDNFEEGKKLYQPGFPWHHENWWDLPYTSYLLRLVTSPYIKYNLIRFMVCSNSVSPSDIPSFKDFTG